MQSSTFAPCKEETVKSYEIDCKSRFLNYRLRSNVAAYRKDISQYLSTFQECPTTNPSLTGTLDGMIPVRVKGIEIETSLCLHGRRHLEGARNKFRP